MTKFRLKMTMLFMLLIGLSVLATGILTGHYYRDNLQSELRSQMTRELKVLAAAAPWPNLSDEGAQSAYLQMEAERFKQIADMRVTYVRTDGIVVGDSEQNQSQLGNIGDRIEVKDALLTGTGTSIGKSDTLHENVIYVANAMKMNGEVSGVIRLSMNLATSTVVFITCGWP